MNNPSVMAKSLRSAQQVLSSSQGVHLLQEPETAEILLAHLDPQNTLFGEWGFLESKQKKNNNKQIKINLRYLRMPSVEKLENLSV
jgi:hypothetical protein